MILRVVVRFMGELLASKSNLKENSKRFKDFKTLGIKNILSSRICFDKSYVVLLFSAFLYVLYFHFKTLKTISHNTT